MNIALIFSPNWTEYVLIETYSIFKNNPAPVKVYLISDKSGEVDASHLTKHFGDGYSVEFINAEDKFNERIPSTKNVSSRFTKYALYRLLLPELIHDDKLFHIDADALVAGDISNIYNTDLKNNYIMGSVDIGADHYNLKKPIGFKKEDPYVNAGVLLMNLKQIREDRVNEKWIYEVNNNKYAAHDQCILNKTSKRKTMLMSNIYNVSPSTGLDIPRNEIKIAHYAGEKPWKSGSVPNARLWFDAVREYKKVFGTVNTNG